MIGDRTEQTFNNPDRFIAGWYWALPSHELRRNLVKAVNLMGRELAIYRGSDGVVRAIDAYCPHMGAHLAQGKVEGDSIRCFFHNWKFDRCGKCVNIPPLEKPLPVQNRVWQVAEKYGIIWVWTGEDVPHPLPFVPELENEECDVAIASHFTRNCHPNVVLINAIDAQHFNTVHNLPLKIVFEKEEINENAIAFHNQTRGGDDSWFIKAIQPFYRKQVTYSLCYWYGSMGTVTVGPDFLHFYIMFALRAIAGGGTEGITLLLTKKRQGIRGWLFNKIVLFVTGIVAKYFGKGDTKIFQTIQFNLQTPIKEDLSILQFIHHVEKQTAVSWEDWQVLAKQDSKFSK